MGKIPDRWEAYKAVGQVIPGTRFIAFKVPLREVVLKELPQSDWFTFSSLLSGLKEYDIELGLVVDLTFTKKYYQRQDVERWNIEYQKIFVEGHNIPNNEVCQDFFDIVDDFLSRNEDNDKVIGVHCTHGLNRTGYMVCRYMIDRLNFAPEDAIKAFNVARGHEMERENYLDSLMGKTPTSSPVKSSSHDHRSGGRGSAQRGMRGHRGASYRGGLRPGEPSLSHESSYNHRYQQEGESRSLYGESRSSYGESRSSYDNRHHHQAASNGYHNSSHSDWPTEYRGANRSNGRNRHADFDCGHPYPSWGIGGQSFSRGSSQYPGGSQRSVRPRQTGGWSNPQNGSGSGWSNSQNGSSDYGQFGRRY